MLFDSFDPTKPLAIDCETISWDDKRGGLKPYHGDRIAGFSIAQGDTVQYFPIRHRTQLDECIDFELYQKEMAEFASRCVYVINQNLKFDLHCFHQDGIEFPNAELADVKVLCRVVFNKHDNYDLEFISNTYCTKYKKAPDEVRAWCKENGTQDYGAAPLSIIRKYACLDTLSAFEAHDILLAQLPQESIPVWTEEKRFTRTLYESESRVGVLIDPDYLQAVQCLLVQKLVNAQINAQEKYNTFLTSKGLPCDIEFNPGSYKQVNRYFDLRGIQPVKWTIDKKTKQKNGPSWDKEALTQIIDDVGVADEILAYKEAQTANSNFCTAWLELRDSSNHLRPSFDQAGCDTGRISSSKPNLQNPPKWIYRAMLIPNGMVGIKFDYSQSEYRIFAHFANVPDLTNIYQENPKTDFHQMLADRLKVSKFRDPVKGLNFGIIYGMGRAKLIRTIAKLLYSMREVIGKKITQEEYDQTILYLQMVYKDAGDSSWPVVAKNLLEDYHRRLPAVRMLLDKIKEVISVRGYIKNYFGRRFYFDLKFAYVALNYLCQGTAADLFKQRVNAIFYDDAVRSSGFGMVTNIHDAVYAIGPVCNAQLYWDRALKIATDVNLRIPILVDGEVAVYNWSNITKVKGSVMDSLADIYFTKDKHNVA